MKMAMGRSKNSLKKSAGFTLIEVLVAMAVFSSVISIALVGLEQGRLSWARGNKQAEMFQMVSQRQDWLDQLFSQANAATFSIHYGFEAPYWLGTIDSVQLISNAPIVSGPGSYAFVQLTIEHNENETERLVFRQWTNQDPYYGVNGKEDQKALTLLDDISDASFSYLLPIRTSPSSLELDLGTFKPRWESLWSHSYDSNYELKLPSVMQFSFTFKGHHYVWFFNPMTYSTAAGQTQKLVQ